MEDKHPLLDTKGFLVPLSFFLLLLGQGIVTLFRKPANPILPELEVSLLLYVKGKLKHFLVPISLHLFLPAVSHSQVNLIRMFLVC